MSARIIFEPEKVQDIIKTYKSGHTIEKTAEIHNVPSHRIRKLLLRNDIPVNRYKGRKSSLEKIKQEEEVKVIELYEQGYSPNEIGKKYNVSSEIISYILKTNSVEIRKQGFFYKSDKFIK